MPQANSTKEPATRTLLTRAFVSRGKTESIEHRHKPASRSHAARMWTMDGDAATTQLATSRPSLLPWAPQLLWSARKLAAAKREPHCAEEGAELGFPTRHSRSFQEPLTLKVVHLSFTRQLQSVTIIASVTMNRHEG